VKLNGLPEGTAPAGALARGAEAPLLDDLDELLLLEVEVVVLVELEELEEE
jgi:hypothetical protein